MNLDVDERDETHHLVCHSCEFERVESDREQVALAYLEHREAQPDHDVVFSAVEDHTVTDDDPDGIPSPAAYAAWDGSLIISDGGEEFVKSSIVAEILR